MPFQTNYTKTQNLLDSTITKYETDVWTLSKKSIDYKIAFGGKQQIIISMPR